MPSNDPRDQGFDLRRWEEDQRQERRRRAAAKLERDRAWRQELATRLREKDGAELGPSYVSVPVPNPAPGAPRFVLVRQDR